jgi:hypothetical protein
MVVGIITNLVGSAKPDHAGLQQRTARRGNGRGQRMASTVVSANYDDIDLRPILPPKPNQLLQRRTLMPETRTAVDVRTATPTKQLVIERTLKASPERVFDAFTDPDQLTKWWWPNGFTCPAAEVDLRVGGTYRVAMEWPDFIPVEAQFSHYMGGEYYEIDRPHRLLMSGRGVNDEQGELSPRSLK